MKGIYLYIVAEFRLKGGLILMSTLDNVNIGLKMAWEWNEQRTRIFRFVMLNFGRVSSSGGGKGPPWYYYFIDRRVDMRTKRRAHVWPIDNFSATGFTSESHRFR